ncbi:MAG: glycosyl transferase, partial [Dongiaceae bacterium]
MTNLLDRLFGHASPAWRNGNPVREELFSVERLEEHARSLAAAQLVTLKPIRVDSLVRRLADNAAVLLDAYRSTVKAVDDGSAITPAAEWLIDNYYLVERQIREIRTDLPPGYYRQLPKLAGGPFAGYPRVFGLTWAFVAHTDSHFDSEMLCRFIDAYQDVQPLTIGELWAVSISLRIVLVENLRRLAARIVHSRAERQRADRIADRLLGAGGRAPEPAAVVLADLAGAPVSDALAVQVVHRLRDQAASITQALTWLDQRLAARGTTADAAVHDEQQRQATGNVTVRNIITSMRLISDVDWLELFERVSLVDRVLAADSGFADMDFPTRNLYRNALEKLALGSKRAELDVAQSVVRAAKAAMSAISGQERNRRTDPGYYLLAGGRCAFEASIGFRPPLRIWLARWSR